MRVNVVLHRKRKLMSKVFWKCLHFQTKLHKVIESQCVTSYIVRGVSVWECISVLVRRREWENMCALILLVFYVTISFMCQVIRYDMDAAMHRNKKIAFQACLWCGLHERFAYECDCALLHFKWTWNLHFPTIQTRSFTFDIVQFQLHTLSSNKTISHIT